MGDTIRIDLYELDNLARDLRVLSGELEALGAQLRLVQYRLSSAAQEWAGEGLERNMRRMCEMSERSELAAHRIARFVEWFSACEQHEKRQFEDRMSTFPKFSSTFGEKNGFKKQEILSFTP